MATQSELQAALDAPWEAWRIFLHPTQRKIVDARHRGPARVTGGAGTGKSVVALHRAAALARTFPEAQVLLTTFSKALAVRLAHSLDSLMGEDSARQRIVVRHLHAEANRWVAKSGAEFAPVSSEDLEGHIERALHGRENEWLSAAFVRSEWEAVVDAHGLSSWEQYQSVSRKGRGVPLSFKKRQLVWAVMQRVLDGLLQRGQSTFNLLCATATRALQAQVAPYQHVIVDECQDFGPAELRLLRALCEQGPDDLFLCGDEGQRIYKGRVSWKLLGIDVRGRSKRLTLNYRTTAQIRRRADALLPGAVEDGDGESESNGTTSVLTGPSPQVVGYASAEEEARHLKAWLQEQAALGTDLREIAVFARTSHALHAIALPVLTELKFAHQMLRADGIPEANQVVVGSFHGAKGLEFRAVALVGCDHTQVPLRKALNALPDRAAKEDFVEQERHLLYVACTRAREQLRVSWSGKGCRWLEAETPTAKSVDGNPGPRRLGRTHRQV